MTRVKNVVRETYKKVKPTFILVNSVLYVVKKVFLFV